MDVGAFTKGDKGRGRGAGKGTQDQTCHNCGRRGHFKKDCRKPGGGAHWPDSRAKAKPKSKGKGKGWKGQNRDKKTVNAVEDDDEEEYHDEEEQEQPENEEGLGAMFVCALSKLSSISASTAVQRHQSSLVVCSSCLFVVMDVETHTTQRRRNQSQMRVCKSLKDVLMAMAPPWWDGFGMLLYLAH